MRVHELCSRRLAKAAGKNLTVDSFGKAIDKTKTVDVTGLGTMNYDPKTHTYSLPMFIYRYDQTSSGSSPSSRSPERTRLGSRLA